jgi:acyl-coenzyme A synthetase/AMP-(fatty) acid ligase
VSVHGILEDVLVTHPAVADAVVVPSSDHHRAGDVPEAFVVRRAYVAARELIAWVADQVPPPRIRRVEFVERLPESPSGEIRRRLLVASA